MCCKKAPQCLTLHTCACFWGKYFHSVFWSFVISTVFSGNSEMICREKSVWEQEQQCMSRMKFKAPASCASRAQHLRPVKISQKGGKGVGTNTDHSIVPACATNHGVDFLLQDTADLWRVTVWVRLPFSRTEHSCCLDVRGQLITVFGSQLAILTFWKTVCF